MPSYRHSNDKDDGDLPAPPPVQQRAVREFTSSSAARPDADGDVADDGRMEALDYALRDAGLENVAEALCGREWDRIGSAEEDAEEDTEDGSPDSLIVPPTQSLRDAVWAMQQAPPSPSALVQPPADENDHKRVAHHLARMDPYSPDMLARTGHSSPEGMDIAGLIDRGQILDRESPAVAGPEVEPDPAPEMPLYAREVTRRGVSRRRKRGDRAKRSRAARADRVAELKAARARERGERRAARRVARAAARAAGDEGAPKGRAAVDLEAERVAQSVAGVERRQASAHTPAAKGALARAQRYWEAARKLEPSVEVAPHLPAEAIAPVVKPIGVRSQLLSLGDFDQVVPGSVNEALDLLAMPQRLAQATPRCQAGKSTAHLVVAWPKEVEPTAAEMRVTCRRMLHRLDLDPGRAVGVIHLDGGSTHCHIIASRIRYDGAVWNGFGADRALALERAQMIDQGAEGKELGPMVAMKRRSQGAERLMAAGALTATWRELGGNDISVPLQGADHDALRNQHDIDRHVPVSYAPIASLIGYRSAKAVLGYVWRR